MDIRDNLDKRDSNHDKRDKRDSAHDKRDSNHDKSDKRDSTRDKRDSAHDKSDKRDSKKIYRTRQQDSVEKYFRLHPDSCVTADEIYLYFMNSGEKIGKATVYRCLDKMVENGEIKKFLSDGGEGAMYQLIDGAGGCDRHFHLKCTRCGTVIHMDCEFMDEFERHIMRHHGFKVDNGRTIIYGLCEACSSAG